MTPRRAARNQLALTIICAILLGFILADFAIIATCDSLGTHGGIKDILFYIAMIVACAIPIVLLLLFIICLQYGERNQLAALRYRYFALAFVSLLEVIDALGPVIFPAIFIQEYNIDDIMAVILLLLPPLIIIHIVLSVGIYRYTLGKERECEASPEPPEVAVSEENGPVHEAASLRAEKGFHSAYDWMKKRLAVIIFVAFPWLLTIFLTWLLWPRSIRYFERIGNLEVVHEYIEVIPQRDLLDLSVLVFILYWFCLLLFLISNLWRRHGRRLHKYAFAMIFFLPLQVRVMEAIYDAGRPYIDVGSIKAADGNTYHVLTSHYIVESPLSDIYPEMSPQDIPEPSLFDAYILGKEISNSPFFLRAELIGKTLFEDKGNGMEEAKDSAQLFLPKNMEEKHTSKQNMGIPRFVTSNIPATPFPGLACSPDGRFVVVYLSPGAASSHGARQPVQGILAYDTQNNIPYVGGERFYKAESCYIHELSPLVFLRPSEALDLKDIQIIQDVADASETSQWRIVMSAEPAIYVTLNIRAGEIRHVGQEMIGRKRAIHALEQILARPSIAQKPAAILQKILRDYRKTQAKLNKSLKQIVAKDSDRNVRTLAQSYLNELDEKESKPEKPGDTRRISDQ